MADYIRARSSAQKQERMNEIMEITDKLFSEYTYHEITLTTIAEALNWTRSNLYKYVTTKEEIFLELYLKKQREYFRHIIDTFSNKTNSSDLELAELWANILDHHHDFLSYYGILTTILETNVTIEKLVVFKKESIIGMDTVINTLGRCFSMPFDQTIRFYWTVIFYSCGLNNGCYANPLVQKAIEIAELPTMNLSFHEEIKKFILVYTCGNRNCI